MADDLALLDATGQADLVASGSCQPADLVDAAIRRIERLDGELNSVIAERFQQASDEALSAQLPSGPFRGVPILVKDLGAGQIDGLAYHRGNRALKEAGYRQKGDSWLVQRLKRAGFVICGKTNVPELGFSCTTEPVAYPSTRNPWDTMRSPAGSSGGSAAAVAAGLVPVATASDGGGSIRMPASVCGLVGLKPSRGRVSSGPFIGEAGGGRAVEHVVTRTVRDCAALLDVLAGEEAGDPIVAPPPLRPFRQEVGADPGRLKVGMIIDALVPFGGPDPDVVDTTSAVCHQLAEMGHHIEAACPVALTSGDERALSVITIHAATIAASADVIAGQVGREVGPDDFEPRTWEQIALGRSITGTQLAGAREQVIAWSRDMARWWAGGFDLLVTPTVGTPAAPLGRLQFSEGDRDGSMARVLRFNQYAPAFNWTGQPAISLPLGESGEGLPIGVQIVAAYGREDLLIRIASQLEVARPWSARRPGIHA
ncbi:MAG: 6-aminohexanoate-cyclic-dimer hydrolase [Acidimicrobiales bacterium]|nr:6-aminohexanoate-cyclic-dimer hydrolase [Acidimicrobiales bacterium]